MNKADAEDIVAGLGVSDAHAAAIVKYRDEKGAFKSIEDLQKVPGTRCEERSRRKRTSWNSSLRLIYNLTLQPNCPGNDSASERVPHRGTNPMRKAKRF